jgi:hypothetical protein
MCTTFAGTLSLSAIGASRAQSRNCTGCTCAGLACLRVMLTLEEVSQSGRGVVDCFGLLAGLIVCFVGVLFCW